MIYEFLPFRPRYAGLMFGEMIPEDNPYWHLYIEIRDITSLLLCKHFPTAWCNLLKVLISEHHQLFVDLFHLPLKPKQHFMTHYPTIIKKIGPLNNIWCIRFESKHRESKLSSNVAAYKINMTHTLAIKHQLKLNNHFMINDVFYNKTESGKIENCDTATPNFSDKIKKELLLYHNLNKTNWVKKYETTYKINDILVLDIIDDNEFPTFGIINVLIK